MKAAWQWFFPGGALLLAALALISGLGPEGMVEKMVTGYPWAVFGMALFLAAFFHRSRVVVALVALLATYWMGVTRAGGFTGLFFFGAILAITLGATAFMKDRGLTSLGGILQMGSLLVVGAFSALFIYSAPADMAAFLSAEPLPLSLTLWSGFPQAVFLAFALALPVILAAVFLRNGAVERGILWTLVLAAVGLYLSGETATLSLFLMAGGLTLSFAVVETSYAMAYKDDLTGLPARRALMRDLESMGAIFTVCMVDVDHFKKFNDRHGHDVGDQVLRMVATQLGKTPRGAKAYRYGGEEFTLLFPGKTWDEALPQAEAARLAVEAATFTLRHWRRPRKRPVDPGAWKFREARNARQLHVTVSVGIADSTGPDSEPDVVLKKADRALYRAKKAGRNRVSK